MSDLYEHNRDVIANRSDEPPEEFHEPPYESFRRVARCKDGVPMIPKKARVLVIQNKFVQRSVIYVPDTAQAKPTTGVVVAIGPDVEDGFVELDESIVFSLYAGVEINIVNDNGEVVTYLSLTTDEIAGQLVADPESLVPRVKK